MAKIRIAGPVGSGISTIDLNTGPDSTLELTVGAAKGMSKQQVKIFERDAPKLEAYIAALRTSAHNVKGENRAVAVEATKVADAAERIVKTKQWHDVSISDLVRLCKQAGDLASPIIETATKVVTFLRFIHGN